MNRYPGRLRYFANVRIPSERANAIQIVSMCSAFAGLGMEVELLYPKRYNPFAAEVPSLFAHYGVKENFRARQLYSLDLIDRVPRILQPPAFRIQSFTFGMQAVREIRGAPDGLSYIRDNATLALAAARLPEAARKRLFYEAHDFPSKPRSARALVGAVKRCGGVVAITRGLAGRFESAGLSERRLYVAPDGVDLRRFEGLPDAPVARAALELPVEGPLLVYAGQLFPWKGVETLVRAASRLDECRVLLLGGREEDRRRLKREAEAAGAAERILFRNPVPPGEVPLYLRAADVLVLPNSSRFPISAHYTSPMKLFEYMAAQRPIVASDLPSLREVLQDDGNALLVPPDDPGALAAAAARLLTDPALQDRLVAKAYQDVARYDWHHRAGGIWAFLERRMNDEEPT